MPGSKFWDNECERAGRFPYDSNYKKQPATLWFKVRIKQA